MRLLITFVCVIATISSAFGQADREKVGSQLLKRWRSCTKQSFIAQAKTTDDRNQAAETAFVYCMTEENVLFSFLSGNGDQERGGRTLLRAKEKESLLALAPVKLPLATPDPREQSDLRPSPEKCLGLKAYRKLSDITPSDRAVIEELILENGCS